MLMVWTCGKPRGTLESIMTSVKTRLLPILLIVIFLMVGAAIFIGYVNGRSPSPKAVTKTASSVDLTQALNDPTAYANQDVSVKGNIAKIGSPDQTNKQASENLKAEYLLISNDASPKAIKLDFGKTNIDPAKYAVTPSKSNVSKTREQSFPSAKSSVTVTGKLTVDSSTHAVRLVVKAIQ
jgi:hypothetical protein